MKTSIQTTDGRYRNKDLGLAAFLAYSGMALLDVERNEAFSLFVFDAAGTCDHLASLYWAGQARVDPKQYNLVLRGLKDRLFSRRYQ